MRILRLLGTLGVFLLVAGLGVAAYLTRDTWRAWLLPAKPAAAEAHDDHAGHDHGPTDDRIKLTPQAQANLRLVVDAAIPEGYSRTLLIPGMVVDRPGLSDRGVVSPVAGVVTQIAIQPGDTVRAGATLYTLKILSEVFQQSQAELFKASRDLVIAREQIARVRGAEGVLPATRIIEAENVERRLATSVTAYRQELLTRGLKPDQIDAVAAGKFVTEISVPAPTRALDDKTLIDATPGTAAPADKAPPNFEVKEIRAQLGEQVQAGQVLCTLANHQLLYVEGRAFKSEAGLLEKAAQNGWPVKAEFAEEANGWPATEDALTIRHLANAIDPTSRTFAFYLSLQNQSRAYTREGQTFLVWRFRPGQRVRLRVPVEQFADVFVFPAAAVAREGPDAYVFRQNGDVFQRKPVNVLFEEQDTVVVANDGSIGAGQFFVRNGAAAIQRAIKAKAAAGGGGHEGHDHAH